MTTAVWIVVGTVLMGLGAAVCHEGTHWLVARLLGRDAWVEWRELNCYHTLPMAGPEPRDYLVGVAPFAVGSVVALAWLVAGFDVTIPVLVAWGVYTLNGIPNDFRLDPGEPPTVPDKSVE